MIIVIIDSSAISRVAVFRCFVQVKAQKQKIFTLQIKY